VVGGFKYRYQFIVGGEMVIDETSPFDVSQTDRITNIMNVPLSPDLEDISNL